MTDCAKYVMWLEWFYQNVDFGPAHDDVMEVYQRQFTEQTGIAMDWNDDGKDSKWDA